MTPFIITRVILQEVSKYESKGIHPYFRFFPVSLSPIRMPHIISNPFRTHIFSCQGFPPHLPSAVSSILILHSLTLGLHCITGPWNPSPRICSRRSSEESNPPFPSRLHSLISPHKSVSSALKTLALFPMQIAPPNPKLMPQRKTDTSSKQIAVSRAVTRYFWKYA